MQEAEQCIENVAEHGAGVRGDGLVGGELHLGEFEVPVTDLVPREVEQAFARLAELVAIECGVRLGLDRVETVEDPTIGVGSVRFERAAAREQRRSSERTWSR